MQGFIHSGGLNAGFGETRLHVYACMQSFMHRAGGGECLGMRRCSPSLISTYRSLDLAAVRRILFLTLNARPLSLPPARSRPIPLAHAERPSNP